MIDIRPARMEHAEWIAEHLRAEDEREVRTATGGSPRAMLPLSFSMSRVCYTIRYTDGVTVEKDPLAIFGVAGDPARDPFGIVWLLGTDDVKRAWHAILKTAPQWLDRMAEDFERGLCCLADLRNETHIRWLALTDFVPCGTVTVRGQPFQYATRTHKESERV